MFVDVGVYGASNSNARNTDRKTALRAYEKFTLQHQGFQALYAETLMTYEEFCEMFPSELYFKVCPHQTQEILNIRIRSFKKGKGRSRRRNFFLEELNLIYRASKRASLTQLPSSDHYVQISWSD